MSERTRTTPLKLIPKNGFVIEFPGVSDAQAGQFAEELESDLTSALEDEKATDKVERIKIDPETQEIGTVLAVILGAKATVALAVGFWHWMSRKNQATLTIKLKDGTIVEIRNTNSEDIAKQIEALNLGLARGKQPTKVQKTPKKRGK